MKIDNLKGLFVDQVQELCSAEDQFGRTLPMEVEAATSPEFKAALTRMIAENEHRTERLFGILRSMGQETNGKWCSAMEGHMQDYNGIAAIPDLEVRDAGLIAQTQKMLHFLIAAYGTACTYSKVLTETYALDALKECIAETKVADEKLTRLAESANMKAAA